MSIDAALRPSQPTPTLRIARSFDDIVGCLSVRLVVFVGEQEVPLDEEVDAYDADATHYCCVLDGHVVGTARLVLLERGWGKIGRVAVLRPYRRRGIATALMRRILDHEASALSLVTLDAQVTAIGFYERFGFVAEDDVFMDAGIPHRRMVLKRRQEDGAPEGAPCGSNVGKLL
ncbi:MAG: GNAT family N-acetyltransferase [Chthonomonadales bacterium]|nr:GNAT family N-acetyltransferase [Chthonomonadales bacterium]